MWHRYKQVSLCLASSNKTTKLTSHKNEMDRKGNLSKPNIPYYRDELREKDRLKRLYENDERKKYTDSKKHHSKNFKSEKYNTSDVSKTLRSKCKNIKNGPNRINVTPPPQVIYVPVPLIMPNPFMRFSNIPMAMPKFMTPVRFQQMPTFFYNPVPVPTHVNYYKARNQFRRFS